MGEIDDNVKRFVWERDGFRCRECGVAVARTRGCKPQTHHIMPQKLGGSDDPSNLVTLCLPCHAGRASLGHRRLLEETDPKTLPNFVKWLVWDLGLNLIGYAEWLSPRRFPAEQVLEDLKVWQRYLDLATEWAKRVIEAHPPCVVREEPFEPAVSLEEWESVVAGVRRGWYAHAYQQFFEEQIGKARNRWSGTRNGPGPT